MTYDLLLFVDEDGDLIVVGATPEGLLFMTTLRIAGNIPAHYRVALAQPAESFVSGLPKELHAGYLNQDTGEVIKLCRTPLH